MNTANIAGKSVGIYGVGPSRQYAGHAATFTDGIAFVSGVRNAVGDYPVNPGATYGLDGARFIVGGFVPSVVLPRNVSESAAASFASDFLTSWPGIGRGADDAGNALGFGYWRDGNGRVWLDVVAGYASLDTAREHGRANGEIAIWDARANVEILL